MAQFFWGPQGWNSTQARFFFRFVFGGGVERFFWTSGGGFLFEQGLNSTGLLLGGRFNRDNHYPHIFVEHLNARS